MASRRVLLHLVGGLGTSLRPIASIRARSSTRCAALGGQMLVAWTTTLMRQPGVDAAAVSIWGGQMAPEHVTIGLSKSRANGRSTGCSLGARMLPDAGPLVHLDLKPAAIAAAAPLFPTTGLDDHTPCRQNATADDYAATALCRGRAHASGRAQCVVRSWAPSPIKKNSLQQHPQ